MNSHANEIITVQTSAGSAIIKALLIGAPFIFFLIYVGVSSAKIRELRTNTGDIVVIHDSTTPKPQSEQPLIQNLQKQNDSLRDVITNSSSSQKSYMQLLDQVVKFQKDNTQMGAQNSGLQNQLQDAGNKIDQIENENNAFQTKIVDLQREVGRANDENGVVKIQNGKLRDQIADLTGRGDQVQQLQTLLTQCRNQTRDLQSELLQCKNQLNDGGKLKEMQTQLTQCINQNRNYSSRFQELQSQLTQCNNELAKCKSRVIRSTGSSDTIK
jgi:uncharacterized coiled-coil DUF342 family protein